MSGAIVLVGGGGHAKVVTDAVRAFGVSIAGFVDDDPQASVPGLDHLGGLDAVREPWILCVGDVPTRLALLERLDGVAASVMHPSAVIGERVELGVGIFIGPNAVVNTDASIEAHAVVNSGSIVEHDAHVGYSSHVAPAAVLCGAVDVGTGCLVGAGSVVLPGVRIGDHAVIGAGSVVTADVPPGCRAVGSPARVLD